EGVRLVRAHLRQDEGARARLYTLMIQEDRGVPGERPQADLSIRRRLKQVGERRDDHADEDDEGPHDRDVGAGWPRRTREDLGLRPAGAPGSGTVFGPGLRRRGRFTLFVFCNVLPLWSRFTLRGTCKVASRLTMGRPLFWGGCS